MEGRDWVQHFGLIMPRLAQACPTLPDFAKWGFHSFYENLVHWCALFIVYNESPYGPLSFWENRMSGKNLVLELWPKMLSANQIAGIFDHLYLLKGLIPHIDFLHANRHPWKEEAEWHFGVVMPRLAQACPTLPNFACGTSGLLERCSESGNDLR